MTCNICGEKTIPGVVCCDILIDELDNETPHSVADTP